MTQLAQKLKNFYTTNETKLNISFFLGGVLFDILTVNDIDNPITILQQVIYLFVIGVLLYFDFFNRRQDGELKIKNKALKKLWVYHELAIHFLMGGLLSIYSIFFVKSASIFSSFVFLIFMISLMVINEIKFFQQSKINFKFSLYLVCVFSFFSMIFPVLLGFVGWQPFALTLLATLFFLWAVYRLMLKKTQNPKVLRTSLIYPGVPVLMVFGLFYYLGWIPPVPLSVQEIGIFHNVEKVDNEYVLYHETPRWMFWLKGDQHFLAEEGDKVFVFVRVFSPARFSDKVVLHWQLFNDKRKEWLTTDRIPMSVVGGRKGGYRGYASKQNYQEGDYRVLVETKDGREIGRLNFWVSIAEQPSAQRQFETITR